MPTLDGKIRGEDQIVCINRGKNILIFTSDPGNVFNVISNPTQGHISITNKPGEESNLAGIYISVRPVSTKFPGADHDDPVLLPVFGAQRREQVIGNVPGDVVHAFRGRMGPHDGRLAVVHRLRRRRVRGVRQVDEHAQPVHLVDQTVSQRAQSPVQRCFGLHESGRVRKGVVAHVRQRQVSDAQRVELPQSGDGIAETVAAAQTEKKGETTVVFSLWENRTHIPFDAQKAGDSAALKSVSDVGRAGCKVEGLVVPASLGSDTGIHPHVE